jgi:hypothetical protein
MYTKVITTNKLAGLFFGNRIVKAIQDVLSDLKLSRKPLPEKLQELMGKVLDSYVVKSTRYDNNSIEYVIKDKETNQEVSYKISLKYHPAKRSFNGYYSPEMIEVKNFVPGLTYEGEKEERLFSLSWETFPLILYHFAKQYNLKKGTIVKLLNVDINAYRDFFSKQEEFGFKIDSARMQKKGYRDAFGETQYSRRYKTFIKKIETFWL